MANFGDILSSLNIPANYSIRRNSADDAFESFLPLVMAGSDKEVLFNSSGAIGASPALKFDTDSLIVNYQLRSPDGVLEYLRALTLLLKPEMLMVIGEDIYICLQEMMCTLLQTWGLYSWVHPIII